MMTAEGFATGKRREPLRLVKITGDQDDWDPSSDTISADDDIRGRGLGELEAIVLDAEAAGYVEGLSEDDARTWFADDDAADMPREVRAWAEAGAEPGELYQFVYNVGRE